MVTPTAPRARAAVRICEPEDVASLAVFLASPTVILYCSQDAQQHRGAQGPPPGPRSAAGFPWAHTAARVALHSCGSVAELIPDFIDIGVEILNPVQPAARDMDTRELKRRFGRNLAFWGGFDTQHVLPRGSAREIEAEARKRIADLAPGGGFVFAPVHAIQSEVPPDNVVGMFLAARERGTYPIVEHG